MSKIFKYHLVLHFIKTKECFGFINEKFDYYELIKEEITYEELDIIITDIINKGFIKVRKNMINNEFQIQFQNFQYYIHSLSFTDEVTRNRIFNKLIDNCWFQL